MANIGKSIIIKGDLTGDEDLEIEGKVDGRIQLPKNQVTIGTHGIINAEIDAKSIVVVGTVTGNLRASERLEIQASGSVQGDIRAPRLLIQEGAISEEEAQDHPMRNFVECCIGGDAPVPDMSITAGKQLEPGDVLLACSDGLWSGLSDDDMAGIGKPGEDNLVDNLKALSIKALSVNSPHSDNTTGTALRWLGS